MSTTHRQCELDDCDAKHLARGYCRNHYYALKRNGTPHITSRFYDPEKAIKHYLKASGDCQIWTGMTGANGYGRIAVNGKAVTAHRYIWSKANGQIPDGMELDHICHNPACCKLEHLRLATRAQNTAYKSGPRADNRSSGVRNVYRSGNGWTVSMTKEGEQFYFGKYASKDEAAAVAAEKRALLFGEFAGKG